MDFVIRKASDLFFFGLASCYRCTRPRRVFTKGFVPFCSDSVFKVITHGHRRILRTYHKGPNILFVYVCVCVCVFVYVWVHDRCTRA